MAMVSAIQEAQRDNLRSFNDYMMKVLQVMTYFNPIQIFGFVSLYFGHILSHACDTHLYVFLGAAI
jgi:hypothetical protein